jgi:hypothetical protein
VPNCQYCDTTINEEYNFCIDCEKQVKCLTCGSYLLKNKSKCLGCGTLVCIPQSTVAPMNTFSLEEEQSEISYSRKLNLSFTDTAIDKVAVVLSGHVPLTPSINTRVGSKQSNCIPSQQAVLEELSIETTIQAHSVETGKVLNILEENIAANYFDKDGQDYLISRSPDYKGKNKKTQQQRFILLYAWAHYLFFKQSVTKDHLSQAAKINKIYESKNYAGYFSEVAKKYFMNIDGAFKLNPAGQAEVNTILSEMQDEEVKGAEYWSPSRKSIVRVSKITKEMEQEIDEWIIKPSRLENFDVRKIKTAADYALFAIYDITKEIKEKESVKPIIAYTYLVKRYKTISIIQNKFTTVLSNKAYSKYFERTSDGSYYLTQEAESTVEKWIDEDNDRT